MKGPFKIAVIIVSIVVVIAITLMVAVVVLVDPNDFREEIAASVKESSGRDLQIDDELELSLFPTIGLKLGKTSLGNLPGFGDQPFLEINSAQLTVALLPLLRSELVVDQILLDGFHLQLITLADGTNNWTEKAEGRPAASAKSSPENSQTGGKLAGVTLGGVKITDGQISYRNQLNNATHKLENFSLNVGAFSDAEPFEIALSTRISSTAPQIQQDITLHAEVLVDLEKQILSVSGLELALKPLTLTGNLSLKQMGSDNPKVEGNLDLAEFNLKELLEKLGIGAPQTSDDQVLKKFAGHMEISAGTDQLNLSSITLQLDDTTLTGQLGIKNFSDPAISLVMAISAIDLDRYLPAADGNNASSSAEHSSDNKGQSTPTNFSDLLAPLKTLNAQGNITIEQIKVAGLVTNNVEINLSAKEGRLSGPIKAALYQGTFDGTIELNAKPNPPHFSTKQRLTRVELGDLGESLFKSKLVSGIAVMNLDLNTSGNDADQVTANLNGELNAELHEGSLNGFNLDGAICKAQGAIKSLKGAEGKACPEEENTRFSALQTAGTITNGVLQVSKLFLEQPRQEEGKFLHITGGGQVNLVKSDLNLNVQAKSVRATGDEAMPFETRGEVIPVSITGSFDQPLVRPDLQQVLKGKAAGTLKNKLLEKLDEGDAGDEEDPKTQMKKQLLKGLFGG